MYASRTEALREFLSARLQQSSLLARLLLVTLFGLLAITSAARADDADPPDRVARMSYLQGDVSVQLANANEWVPARINRPLVNNDQLWTNDNARAELQVGSSSVQVDENTQLSVLEISDRVLQLQLTQGVAIVYVRGMQRDEVVEVDTPNAAAAIQEPGTYRIAADPSGEVTVVQVRNGSAEVSGERQNFSLRENEQVTLSGATRLSAEFDDLGRMDDFDRWANARNVRGNHTIAAQYVSTDVIGYEDLDDYGYWANEPDYGQVWIPTRVVGGWAPYRYGHWEWVAPWGWTWIDDAPWGFAPFHYGRWAYTRDRWCWVPGPRAVRAVYAPALVAWVGTPGVSVSISAGAGPVGWVPLGPREIYRPSYRVTPGYVERVNLSNSLVRRDDFDRRYREPPHEVNYVNRAAVTVVSANAIRSAAPVNRNIVRTDFNKLRPVESAPNIQPERAALVGAARPVAPPSRIITREVVARRAPAPIARAEGPNVVPPARNNLRVVEPTEARRPFPNERGQITPDSAPAVGQGPRVFTRPQENAVPNRQNNPTPEVNRPAPQDNNRVIESDRGVRRGFTTPRVETPNVQRAEPAPQPEQRSVAPQFQNRQIQRVEPREMPRPEVREQPREQPRPAMPAPQPRVEPQVQRAEPRPQPAPQAQPQARPSRPNNNDNEDRGRRPLEKDTR